MRVRSDVRGVGNRNHKPNPQPKLPPRTSTANTTILRITKLARSNPPFLSFGPVAGKHEGTVLGLGIGCFGELSAGFNDVCTFIARNRAVSYMGHFDDKSPKEALVPLEDPPRVGSCSHFRLERPHLGSQPQARRPAVACRPPREQLRPMVFFCEELVLVDEPGAVVADLRKALSPPLRHVTARP